MRLNLAPKPTEGIEEKLLKSWDQELGRKYSKIIKMKNIAAQHRRWINTKARLYWCKSRVYSRSTEVTALPHLIENKNVFLAHFYTTNARMKLGSGKELQPSRVLYIGPSKRLNDYYAPRAPFISSGNQRLRYYRQAYPSLSVSEFSVIIQNKAHRKNKSSSSFPCPKAKFSLCIFSFFESASLSLCPLSWSCCWFRSSS